MQRSRGSVMVKLRGIQALLRYFSAFLQHCCPCLIVVTCKAGGGELICSSCIRIKHQVASQLQSVDRFLELFSINVNFLNETNLRLFSPVFL